jgi:hypothetical protein
VPPSQTPGQILLSRNYQDAKRKHITNPGGLILNKTEQNTRDNILLSVITMSWSDRTGSGLHLLTNDGLLVINRSRVLFFHREHLESTKPGDRQYHQHKSSIQTVVPPSQTPGQILLSRNYQDAKRKHITNPGGGDGPLCGMCV